MFKRILIVPLISFLILSIAHAGWDDLKPWWEGPNIVGGKISDWRKADFDVKMATAYKWLAKTDFGKRKIEDFGPGDDSLGLLCNYVVETMDEWAKKESPSSDLDSLANQMIPQFDWYNDN